MHAVECGWDAETAGHKSPGSGRVHHEINPHVVQHAGRDLDAVAVLHPGCHGCADEMMVHVGPKPVIIGDVIVGTRGDEQPLWTVPVAAERPACVMAIEREAAFQAAPQLGEARDPAAVRREIVTVVQPVATRQALESEIGERRARLPDREAGMRAALEQGDIVALDGEDASEQRAGEAAADDGYAHAAQVMGGSVRPVTFIRARRAMRALRQALQLGSRATSHRSTVTAAVLIGTQ